ncbi:MAG: hypothetical protein U1C74_05405 [Phenylobacterium sp.]|nr:hypothetical protein [Phenylobacterium sp.]
MDASHGRSAAGAAEGARNLLVACAGLTNGDTLLLLTEPHGRGHYDDDLAPFLADAAESLGARARIMTVEPVSGPEATPVDVLDAIAGADHTIFLTRTGDQLRFHPLPGAGTKTMCYALDFDFLADRFATTPYGLMLDLQSRLARRLAEAGHYRITCPRGTDLSARIAPDDRRAGDFTVRTFPAMILPPLPADGANGVLALSHALTSTYIHDYADSVIPLPSTATLRINDGQILAIEADPSLATRIDAQFERVAGLFGGAPRSLNSWHCGLNPATYFPAPALSDIDRWSGVAFGSPRYAHFHMCGDAPGDICGQIFDPTIELDGEVVWDRGRLVFFERAENRALIERFGLDASQFTELRPLGLTGALN